jgi:alkanesulfonate monooxygenase SsuD/methylene tetrahydromethanopterin reductase-like flavin-dependent oxidoreductase (luciferase family)
MVRQLSPWVAQRRDRVEFAVQAFAWSDDPRPGRSVVEAGVACERFGLDAYFIGDHPAYATEAWLHLTAIAARTSLIGLGSIVNCVSYRHPALIARLAADFDQLSNGRLILGLGIGWNDVEYRQLGQEFPPVRDRQRLLEESVAIIRGSWGDTPYSLSGEQVWVENLHVQPAPVQGQGLPLVIAGGGEKVTFRQVAQLADACNFGPGRNVGAARTPDQIAAKWRALAGHCRDAGRPFDDILRTHFTSWIMLAPTEKEALAKRDRYYPDGMTEEQQATRVIGTPEMAIAHYQALADAGFQYFVAQVLDATDQETMALLAREVAPHIRPGARPAVD